MEKFNKEDVIKAMVHYDERIIREEAIRDDAEEIGDVEAAFNAELELNYLCSSRMQMQELLGDLLADEAAGSGGDYNLPFTD